MTESTKGKFFAVSRERFHEACDLGIGPATAYLVIACGTGRSQVKSKWSTGAIATYGKINFPRAIKYIAALEDAGLLANIGTRKKPLYEFAKGDDAIWLPNAIIMGLDGFDVTPAVARLRQSRNVELLRLFIDLYYHQNLGFHGGIDPELMNSPCEVQKLGEYGAASIWCATGGDQQTYHDNPLANGDLEGWWEKINMLTHMGLIRSSLCIFDGPAVHGQAKDLDGEYVYTLDGPSAEETLWEDIATYLQTRDVQWLEHIEDSNPGDYLFIVPKHIKTPHAVELYRMTYTARTSAASKWWAGVMSGRQQIERMTGRLGVA